MLTKFKKSNYLKVISLCIVFFFSFQILAYSYPPPQPDPYQQKLEKGKKLFFSGEYENAASILKGLAKEFSGLKDRDIFKGETYLLLAVASEKLNKEGKAIDNYCMAKLYLGEGKSIDGIDLKDLKYYKSACMTSNPVWASSYYVGKNAYFRTNYLKSKLVFEGLVSKLSRYEGNETLRGEAYLLLGATHEKLKNKLLAVKYYCKAKKLLGYFKTSNLMLQIKKLKYYKESCNAAVYSKPGKKKGKSFIGTLLGLAILIGGGYLLWKYVLKEKLEEVEEDSTPDYTDNSTWGSAWNSWKFITWWESHTEYTYGPGAGSVTVTWENGKVPQPSTSNNWDDTQKFTIAKTGDVKSLTMELTFAAGGCNNGKRKDTVYVDGAIAFQQTNTFTNACDDVAIKNNRVAKIILTVNNTGIHNIRHVVDLGVNATKVKAIKVVKKTDYK